MMRVESGLILLVAVLGTSGCAAVGRGGGGGPAEEDSGRGGELPTVEEAEAEARRALPVIQFLDDNRHNVAETLGFRTEGDFGTIELGKEPPLPVYEISRKDLRWSEAFADLIEDMKAERATMSRAERAEFDRLYLGPDGNKPAMSLTEMMSRLPEGEGAEAAAFFVFLEMMSSDTLGHVLEKLGKQEPEIWVFRATKTVVDAATGEEAQEIGYLTPIVVRLPEDDRSRWRLFKVGEAPLAKTLRCNPDALYILDVPALYLSFVAKPPASEKPPPALPECEETRPMQEEAGDCLLLPPGTVLPPPDQRPSADDCLVAVHGFPDLYDIQAGQSGRFSDWLPFWELIAKTWKGTSVESTLRQWKDLGDPGG